VKQVKVVNGSDMPIPVVGEGDNGQEKELVEIVANVLSSPTTPPSDRTVNAYTVPSGKRLVITDVSATGGQDCSARIFRS